LQLLRPKRQRKRELAEAVAVEFEPRKQLRLSTSGEIVLNVEDGRYEGDEGGNDAANGGGAGGGRHDGGASDVEEIEPADGGEGGETEEERAAVRVASEEGAAAARRLSDEGAMGYPLESEELWFAVTERLTHSQWVMQGPAEAFEQVRCALPSLLAVRRRTGGV
jgi:hypothetical protein